MKNFILFLFFLTVVSFSTYSAAQQQLPAGEQLMVGYYGRPGAGSLGVLGQYSIEELMPKIKAKADEYAKISGEKNVTPAFHLIYGMASSSPGKNKDYILPLSDEKVMAYINAAKTKGFAVIIDLQLGGLTPVEEVKAVLKYLQYENVHLAIDPEFEVQGLDVRPGKVIGHITGEEVNQVQAAMSGYLKKNSIKEKKILIVHMFTKNMVKDKASIKTYENIDLIMNLDGHGSPKLKVDIYNSLYTADAASKMAGGFKLFFKEDKPSMMTPKQVLGLESVGTAKIKEPPKYINYQ
jgi:hypothetical protein